MQTISLTSRVLKTEPVLWQRFKFIQHDEFKELNKQAKQSLRQSIIANNFTQPFYVWQDKQGDIYCLDGKHRVIILEELLKEGMFVPEELPATFIDCRNKKEAAELVLVYSSIYAKITQQGLFDFVSMYDINVEDMKLTVDIPEFDMLEFNNMFAEPGGVTFEPQSLSDKFIVPPFSVFDTRQGYWQERKREWHKLFDSQESREGVELIAKSGQSSAVYELRNKMRTSLGREPDWDEILAEARKRKLHIYEGASIFDPVLTEVCYKWFCPEGGKILDPFAGGSVRGIVAGMMGHQYFGIDLREDQVQANYIQAEPLNFNGNTPAWIIGDSNTVLDEWNDGMVDFVFSCPPYHDLEQYSDDPADLSNMSYEEFASVYRSIITKAMSKLKQDRFACFVVGDIRDKNGWYRDFVSETINCFRNCIDENGDMVHLYNEVILINVAGSLPIRVGRQFENSRKVGKMHQNVLVFYKGDPKKIKDNFQEIKMEEYLRELNYQPNIALTVTG